MSPTALGLTSFLLGSPQDEDGNSGTSKWSHKGIGLWLGKTTVAEGDQWIA